MPIHEVGNGLEAGIIQETERDRNVEYEDHEPAQPMTAPLSFAGGRLMAIDALRGWAALAVVLFHLRFRILVSDPVPSPTESLLDPISLLVSFGSVGVWLFFVISGFCIHLRWARSSAAGHVPELGFMEFWRRRVRRLYPPYLVALFVYLAAKILDGSLPVDRFLGWSLGLHLVMLQNVDPRTLNVFNSVFWTLAIEEQLYLAYFLLLFLRTRFGWAVTLGCSFGARAAWFALAFAIHRVSGSELLVTQEAAAQWGIWALGALSVEAAIGLVRLPPWCGSGAISMCLLGLAATIAYIDRFTDASGWLHKAIWMMLEPAWGLAFFVGVNYLLRQEAAWRLRGHAPALIRYSAAVGIFSYSLYLTHQLIFNHLWPVAAFRGVVWAPGLVGVFVFLPLSLGFAWVFFVLFERPFLSRPAPAMDAQPVLGSG